MKDERTGEDGPDSWVAKGLIVFSAFPVSLDVLMAIIKETDNKCWQGCGERGARMRCWWERKVVRPLMETSVEVSEKKKKKM